MNNSLTHIPNRAAYTMNEACSLLGGVTRQHLYTLRDRGEIRLVKLGRRTLVPAAEIERIVSMAAPDEPEAPTKPGDAA